MQGQIRLNENLQTTRSDRDTFSSVQNQQKSFFFIKLYCILHRLVLQ
jgi:hypothetical protein